MARLHSDENFDRHVVEELRRLGHDVLTARDAGRDNRKIPDCDVLAFATADGRAVVPAPDHAGPCGNHHLHRRPRCDGLGGAHPPGRCKPVCARQSAF